MSSTQSTPCYQSVPSCQRRARFHKVQLPRAATAPASTQARTRRPSRRTTEQAAALGTKRGASLDIQAGQALGVAGRGAMWTRRALIRMSVPWQTICTTASTGRVATKKFAATPSGVNASTFGANYGTSFSAWDQTSCCAWYPDRTGPWCCPSWCYVDPSPSGSYGSVVADDLYYGYTGSCDNQEVSSCPHHPPDPCGRSNVPSRHTAANASALGMNYGTPYSSWVPQNWCASYAPETMDYWCCSSWCGVHPTCSSLLPSLAFPGRDLCWTDDHCEDKSTAVKHHVGSRRHVVPMQHLW